jgi:hypothetical protein
VTTVAREAVLATASVVAKVIVLEAAEKPVAITVRDLVTQLVSQVVQVIVKLDVVLIHVKDIVGVLVPTVVQHGKSQEIVTLTHQK